MNNNLFLSINRKRRIIQTVGVTVPVSVDTMNLLDLNIFGVTEYAYPTTDSMTLADPSVTVATSGIATLTFGHAYETGKDMLIYTPPGLAAMSGPVPLIFCWHGYGGKGTTVSKNDSIGTGDGTTTTFTGSLTNTTSKQRILYSSIALKKNGVTISTANESCILSGTGVSGSVGYTPTTGVGSSFSITFTTAPLITDVLTITYQCNTIFETGWQQFAGMGDKIPGAIVCMPQIPTTQSDFTVANYDNALAYMVANYNIDTNRLYHTGLSGGAFACRTVIQQRPTQVAAIIMCSGGYGSGWTWTSYTDIGQWHHHGTADTTVSNGLQSVLANANVNDLNIAPLTTAYLGLNHVDDVWNDGVYNRKERTDAVGIAPFDFPRWFSKFSKDALQRATGHVAYAEYLPSIEEYRLANYQVNLLASSSDKTALQARLATLKTALGVSYIIDCGTAALATSATGVNNLTSGLAGTVINNLVDDQGNASSFGFQIVTVHATTTKEQEISNQRMRGRYFGNDRDMNRDGIVLSTSTSTGTSKFKSLNNAKSYKIRIYHASASGTFANTATISATIAGVTKTQYSECNTTTYLEFTTTPVSGEILIAMKPNVDRNVIVQGFELFEL